MVYGVFMRNGNLRFLINLFKLLSKTASYASLVTSYKALEPVFVQYPLQLTQPVGTTVKSYSANFFGDLVGVGGVKKSKVLPAKNLTTLARLGQINLRKRCGSSKVSTTSLHFIVSPNLR